MVRLEESVAAPHREMDSPHEVRLDRLKAFKIALDKGSSAGQQPAEAPRSAQPDAQPGSASPKDSAIHSGGQAAQEPDAARRGNQPAAKAKFGNPKIKYASQAKLDADLATLEKLSSAAAAGDTAALDQLRAALDSCQHVWRRLGDLQYLVEVKLIALVASESPLHEESFRKRCSDLRHQLLEGEPSSLATKMAVSRLLACWLFTQFLELRALESPQDLHSVKSLEQAERRYQVAMRTFIMSKQLDRQLQ